MNSSAKETISPFEKLLAELTGAGVDYAVVGGVAVIANGYVRLTEDLDIIVADDAPNLARLLVVLARFGEGHARELTHDDFPRQEGAVRVIEDFDLDIFVLMRGNSLDTFRPQLRRFESTSTAFHYLSPQQLILLKQDSWRDKDRIDVIALKEILARETPGTS